MGINIGTWALTIRILNVVSAAGLFGLQIWYLIELLMSATVPQIIANIFAPLFLWYCDCNKAQ